MALEQELVPGGMSQPVGPGSGPVVLLAGEPRNETWLARLWRAEIARVIVRRLLAAIPVVWGVTLLTFIVMNLLPGDAASALLGVNASPGQVKALRIKLHLNEPFIERYWNWLWAALHGDLGSSLASGQSVANIIWHRLPITVELVIYGFIVALLIAVPVAVLAARKPDGIFDKVSTAVNMIGLSIAPYVMALVLVLIFAVKAKWLPALGWTSLGTSVGGNLKTLTLPALSLGIPLGCYLMRLFRGDIIEQMEGEDYVVTARAKGISPWQVLTRHGVRNSLFGLITVVGLNVGVLFGNTVILEQIFGLPGIGQELYEAISTRDAPVIEGIVAVFAIVVVLANLAADLLYTALDPRIRHGKSDV
jgi:peptide/nickel transport system permease protein